MDLRVGEVGQATYVIDVEVRRDHVPYVLPVEAECLDLPRGGLVGVQPRSQQAPGRADAAGGGAVLQAEAGINEDQSVGCFD